MEQKEQNDQKDQKKCNIVRNVATAVCIAIFMLFVCMTYRANCVRCSCDKVCNLRKDTVIVVVDTTAYTSGGADAYGKMQKIKDYSSEIATYKYKVDSLSTVVDKVNGQYASTIDMLIDKFNTWVGFWLAVLSLILLLVSVWQYLKIEKYDDKIKQLKTNISGKMKEAERKNKEFKEKSQADFERQISTHKFSTLENRMTSLLLCMSSVPDPQVFSDSNERKEQISYYLELVSNLLVEYLKMIRQEYGHHNLSKTTVDCIPMVLLNLRLSMIRIQGVFRDPSVYVEFVWLIKEIETNESNIRRAKLLDCRNLECLAALIERFNVFKTHVNSCKDVV